MENSYYNQSEEQMNRTGKTPDFVLYLVLSILECLFCNQITGVLGIVFSCLANSDYQSNDYAGYEKNIKRAKTSLIVGLIIGILMFLLAVCYVSVLFTPMALTV